MEVKQNLPEKDGMGKLWEWHTKALFLEETWRFQGTKEIQWGRESSGENSLKGGWRRRQGIDNVGSIKDSIKKLGLYSNSNKNPWEVVFFFFLIKKAIWSDLDFITIFFWGSLKNRFEAGKTGYGQTIDIAQERDCGSMDQVVVMSRMKKLENSLECKVSKM